MSASNGSLGPGAHSERDAEAPGRRHRDQPSASTGSTHSGLFAASAPRTDAKLWSEEKRLDLSPVGGASANLRRSVAGRASPAKSVSSASPAAAATVELSLVQKGKPSTPDLPGQEKINVHQLLMQKRKRAGSSGGHTRHDSMSSTSSQKVGPLPHIGVEYSLEPAKPRTSVSDGGSPNLSTTPGARGWPSFFRDTRADLGGGWGAPSSGVGGDNRKASTDHVLGSSGDHFFGDMNYIGIVNLSRENDERKKRAFRRWRVIGALLIAALGLAASYYAYAGELAAEAKDANDAIHLGCLNRLSGASTTLELSALSQVISIAALRDLSADVSAPILAQHAGRLIASVADSLSASVAFPPGHIALIPSVTIVTGELLRTQLALGGNSTNKTATTQSSLADLFKTVTTLAHDLANGTNSFEDGVHLRIVLSDPTHNLTVYDHAAANHTGDPVGSIGDVEYPIRIEHELQSPFPFFLKQRVLSIMCHPTEDFAAAELSGSNAYLTGASTFVFFLLAGVIMWVVTVNVGTRQREKALGEAHDLLRGLTLISQATVKAVPDPMVAFKADGGILHVNTSACMMTGYTREELLTTNIRNLFIVPEMDIFRSYFMTELTVKRHDDSTFHAEASCGSTGGPTDEIQLYVTVFRDITSRRQAETDLQQSIQEAQDARINLQGFLAFICHELRNPLHGIMGITELLLDSTKLDKKDVELAENISGSTQLMSAILNDVLDYSKIEGGQLEIESIAFDLNRMIREISSVSRMAAERKNLQWKLTVDKKMPRVLIGDPTRLRQILSNLVSNALKFTETGSIELSLKLLHTSSGGDELFVKFAVIDTGIGIAPADQPKLFKMFSQAKISIARKYGGTGLGLSIVRSLVEKMRGTIDLTSELGSGTTFFFTVWLKRCDKDLAEVSRMLSSSSPGNTVRRPKRQAHSGTGDLSSSATQGGGGGDDEDAAEPEPVDPDSQFSILLVEDNVTNRRIACQALLRDPRKRFTVAEAEDGVEGVERANERQFDLILMDVNMPRKDGLQATREIRASSEFNQATPVVALTAQAMQEEKNQCFEAGMDHFISKPFKRVEFVTRIVEIIAEERDKASAPETKRQFESIARDQHIIINRTTHKPTAPSAATAAEAGAGSGSAAGAAGAMPFGSPPSRSRQNTTSPSASVSAVGPGRQASTTSEAMGLVPEGGTTPLLSGGAPQGRFAESTPHKNFL